MGEHGEILQAVETLRAALEGLAVRGLRGAGPRELAALDALHDDFTRIGAEHLAERVRLLAQGVRDGAPDGPAAFMRAWTSLHVFDRVLTLDVAAAALAPLAGEAPAPPAAPVPARAPQVEDRKRLPVLLEDLARAVEDVVATGLGTLSSATQEKLDASFQEASRRKLLRLGTSLRYVKEELARFLEHSDDFSARRLTFFLNRAWLLARSMAEALRADDQATLARLLLAGAAVPVQPPALQVVCVGVLKRQLQNNASFELRFRALHDAPGVQAGQSLVWSCVFAANPRLPSPEANLHLERAELNKLEPRVFLEGKAVTLTGIAVSPGEDGTARLQLGPKVEARAGDPFADWKRFAPWDAARARARLVRHETTPLDLPVELQEELVLEDWELGEPVDREAQKQRHYPLRARFGDERSLDLTAIAPSTDAGERLRAALEELAKARPRPPLFGLLHYEACQLMFQPLAAWTAEGARQLMLADVSLSKRDLLKLIDFHR